MSTLMVFRVKEDRAEWKRVIQNHQPLNDKRIAYICDLHFHESDLRFKDGKCIGTKKNALPLLG